MSKLMSPEEFEQLLKQVRAKLPIQNPLHSFVHNNILMMFEEQEFHSALASASQLYRAQAYWPINRYKDLYQKKKIIEQDIFNGIDHYALHYKTLPVADKLGISLREFYYRLVFSDLAFNDDDTQPNITDRHQWELCQAKMDGMNLTVSREGQKWRAKDYWEKYYNDSLSTSIHPFIIRLISSYLDQGQSFWANPLSEKGFWSFFCLDVETIAPFANEWQKILKTKLAEYRGKSTEIIIQLELQKRGVDQAQWASVLLDFLFDLKGWAGMVNKLEIEPWQATVKAPAIKLVDYIAALMLVEGSLDEYHARLHSSDLSTIYGRTDFTDLKSFQLTLALYQIGKSFQLDGRWVQKFTPQELVQIVQEVDEAERVHQIRLWHEAYEHHYYREALGAITGHKVIDRSADRPGVQVLFCIDDREESIRRHLEENSQGVKTYGVVGFFGIDMKYSSLRHQRLIAQCPPVVNPSRIVREVAIDLAGATTFNKFNKLRGKSDLSVYYHSRTLIRGFISTLFFGLVSIVPMFLQVFFPKQSKSFQNKLAETLSPEPKTEIHIDHSGEDRGYTHGEQAGIVAGILKMCGITKDFSRLVVLLGHGSSSNNNPFKQAYGCGACGGNAGIPNSRAFAKMANDRRVREVLVTNGIVIPNETIFVSGFHDTCTDEVLYFDTDIIPVSHRKEFENIRASLEKACKLNAFERCQRFSSDDAKDTPEKALIHVRERAQDLAQPRPEYGHSTNALAIVGMRDLTQGLFLNRRSFLLTYDWRIDPDGAILQQVVLGGIPVCVNINMDYYFSCVDNDNFGCGSKLPLNLTSLLGVMTGSSSDLRIGLARQMVEIHEPIRNLSVMEAPLARVKSIFEGHPRLKKLLYHHWMRLVVHDPETKIWHIFRGNEFVPLKLETAHLQHYQNSMELINTSHASEDFAEIDS